jgi:adenylate cyclase
MRYNFACILSIMGDKEGALKMLQSILPLAGEYQVRVADSDTDLDSIRDDPRFQKTIVDAKKRLGIGEEIPAT